jgi:plasmid maintenance system killer protein
MPPNASRTCASDQGTGSRRGDGASQHSIRISAQWPIVFVWQEDGAHAVEIVDYH